MFFNCFLAFIFSVEFPQFVSWFSYTCFSLAVYMIFSCSFFLNFSNDVSKCDFLVFTLLGGHTGFLDLFVNNFKSNLGKFWLLFLQISIYHLSLSSFCYSNDTGIELFDTIPETVYFFYFNLFMLCSSNWIISPGFFLST